MVKPRQRFTSQARTAFAALTVAAAVAALTALPGCGDNAKPAAPPADPNPAPAPAAAHPGDAAAPADPAAPARDDLPPADVILDDEALLATVYAAGTKASPFPPVTKHLPSRVSRTRVAVRALHDHLLGVIAAPEDWTKLIETLEAFERETAGGIDGANLAKLIAAWKAWTPEEIAAERELAVRVTRGFDLVRAEGDAKEMGDAKTNVAAIAAALVSPPKAPPSSPAGAAFLALRAAHAALTNEEGEMPEPLTRALGEARAAYDAIGWSGGLGVYLEIVVARLERGGKQSFRSVAITDRALAAFEASGDSVRAALISADRAHRARRGAFSGPREKIGPELDRSVALFERAAAALDAAKCRGQEITDVLFALGETLQTIDRHADAVAAFDRCGVELAYAKADPAQRAPLDERRATSLFRLGRFDDALTAADSAARAYDENVKGLDVRREQVRAAIDEIAAECLVELGRGREGANRYLAAAKRNEKLPAGDDPAARDRFLAARAYALAGARDEARRLIDAELARKDASPQRRIAAATVLRDAGFAAEARSLFDGVAATLSTEQRQGLVGENARIFAAEGRLDDARRAFREAEAQFTGGDLQRPGGPEASRLSLDLARMEEQAGDFEAASRAADRALLHVSMGRYAHEADKAREVYVRALRRRAMFPAAERSAAERVKLGVQGGAQRKLDAAIDLALLRAELAAAGGDAGALKRAEDAVDASGAGDALGPLVGRKGRPVVDTDGPRVRRLANALFAAANGSADGILDAAAALAAQEPDAARVLLRRAAERSESANEPIDWVRWLDLWCGGAGATTADLRAALGAGNAFLAAVPTGRATLLVAIGTDGAVVRARAAGDAGLAKLWEASQIDPTAAKVAAAIEAVSKDGAPLLALLASRGSRVIVCVPSPVGAIPAELLVLEGGASVFDTAAVGSVRSPSELIAASRRTKPSALTLGRSPEALLTARCEIAPVAPCDPKWGARLVELANVALTAGADPLSAVQEAKKKLRDEWKPDEKRPTLPPWAAFGLRGAP